MSKYIVFGDVHGCYKALETAIKLALEKEAIAVFLGDYVDRGPNSMKTLQLIIDAKANNPNWVFLRGNHDQMLLDLIKKVAEPNSEGQVLGSYGFSYDRTTVTYLEYLKMSGDFQLQSKVFIENTKFYHEIDDFIFVHAPLRNQNIPIQNKDSLELLWNYELNPIWDGKSFIHGHSTVKSPKHMNKGLNINTDCGYSGGYLTGCLFSIENDYKEFYRISQEGYLLKN